MRIALVIPSLSAGGAERVISAMANYWAQRGQDVTVITSEATAGDFYALHPQVRRETLGRTRDPSHKVETLRFLFQERMRLRRMLKALQPDVVISFISIMNVVTLWAAKRTGIPVVVSERADPWQVPIGKLWETLRRKLYPEAAAVVMQTESVRPWAEAFVPKSRVVVIPNAVRIPQAEETAYSPGAAGPTVLAVGRFEKQKGFDLLLEAFQRTAVKHPDWSLLILGDGPERADLEKRVCDLGIDKKVRMPGKVNVSKEVLQAADIFVLSSRFEGFPNALCEAMACGLPVISTDCPSGPADIVRDGIDGLLVPVESVDALAEAMERLMTDTALRRQLGNRAVEVAERFSEEKVMRQWETILERISTTRR